MERSELSAGFEVCHVRHHIDTVGFFARSGSDAVSGDTNGDIGIGKEKKGNT